MRFHFPLDRRVGVILRMPLDENEFRRASHFGSPLEDGFDVARFVARRDDDRNARLFRGLGAGSCHDEVRQREMMQGPQPHEKFIRQPAQRKRKKNLLCDFYRFESSELQQVVHVFARQPILIKVARGKVETLCDAQRQLPEPAIKIEEDARARCAKLFNFLKDALHIPQVVDEIGEDDDVECFVDRGEIVRVGFDEFEIWIFCFRAADHLR